MRLSSLFPDEDRKSLPRRELDRPLLSEIRELEEDSRSPRLVTNSPSGVTDVLPMKKAAAQVTAQVPPKRMSFEFIEGFSD